jgi:hypothetical protein
MKEIINLHLRTLMLFLRTTITQLIARGSILGTKMQMTLFTKKIICQLREGMRDLAL